jgi:hypothetical protein
LKEGATLLQGLIKKFLVETEFLKGMGKDVDKQLMVDCVLRQVDAYMFDEVNDNGVVEAHATFTGMRGQEKLWDLEIIWGMASLQIFITTKLLTMPLDADVPLKASSQMPYFGYEMKVDKKRVCGPGHVFFKEGVVPTFYREADKTMKVDPWTRMKGCVVLNRKRDCILTNTNVYYKY